MTSPDQLLQRAYEAHQAHRLGDAERLYNELLAIEPDDVDGCNLLGLLCLESGQPTKAIAPLTNAVRLRPDDPQSRYNLGIANKDLSEFDKAAEQFREVIQLSPDHVDACIALANVLRANRQLDEAISTYEAGLSLAPKHAGAAIGLSDALNELAVEKNKSGEVDAAIDLLRRAITVHAGNAEAQMNLGIILEQAGEPREAASAIRAAIMAKPDLASAHYQLAHLRDHQSTDEEIAAMETLFDRESHSVGDRARLAYGIGKALEKRADYDREFAWLRKAHALMSVAAPYDSAMQRRFINSVIDAFPEVIIVPRTEAISGAAESVFVTGLPRSGTTLTEQILASHPDVIGVGETGLVGEVAVQVRGTGRPEPRSMLSLASELIAGLHRIGGGSPWVVETSPTNFLHIGLVATLLPSAKLIHCTRHPLDTCLSIYQHPLSKAHAYAHTTEDLADYYIGYRRLMDHWHKILPGRVYEQSYEHVVGDLEASVRALLEHCGLPFDPVCLEFHKTKRVVRTPSASQVRRPIYKSSVGRWRNYTEQLAPLRKKLEEGLGLSLE